MGAGSVAVAVVDDMPIFELGIACEVFGTKRPELADPWYDLRLCAARPGVTRTGAGFVVDTPFSLQEVAGADTVIVPAMSDDFMRSGAAPPAELVEVVGAAAAAGARVMSLCTGVFVLAAAGLLDGRRAAAHWMHADTLARRHPRIHVDATVLYVDDGALLTSAGCSAGLDLCLSVLRRDLGAQVANQVARRMVVPAHRPGGQSQYIDLAVPETDGAGLSPTLHWAGLHLDRPLTVNDLAEHAGVSVRTLVRRFHSATGTTPSQWLLGQRLLRARLLLESTDLPIDAVGERSGLGTAANLRRHFSLHFNVTPTSYRRAFHRKV